MATHNDITGDALVSRQANENYRNNYDRIFGKKKEKQNVGTSANGSAVSVSSVSSAGSTGTCGESGSDNSQGSTNQG